MKRFIFTTIFALISIVSFSQSPSCYNLNRGKGIDAFNHKRYTEAKAYFQQATKCPDKPKNNDLQSWINKCNAAINSKPNPKPQKKTDTYILIDGTSTTSSSHSASSSSEWFNVSTDARSWNTWGVPDWCYITDKNSTGFRLNFRENSSTSARNDYMEVRTPKGHSARISISQSGKIQSYPTAQIKEIKVDHNQALSDGKGMIIHVIFSVQGMEGKTGNVAAYFYDESGNALVDTNNKYGTTGNTSHVAVSKDITPEWPNTNYSDLKLSIPYSELHQTGIGTQTLKFKISIWDKSKSPHVEFYNGSSYTTFTYTPASLAVDGDTSDKTKYFSEDGGREYYTVNSIVGDYETWGVPSWCSIEGKTSSGFTLVCNKNTTTSERSDYMKVKAAGKEIRIDIKQAAGTGPSAKITNVTQEHNVMVGLVKGMNIKLKFETSGMKNRNVTAIAWFYYGDNTTKLNNGYGGQVNVSKTDMAPYDETTFTMTLFMPYTSLNMAKGWSGSLSFDVVIRDSNGNDMVRNENNTFTFNSGF